MSRTLRTRSPEEAAELLRRGGLVAFPTETVFGLGANALDSEAVARIFVAKDRPADNPFIVHVDEPGAVDRVAAEVPGVARTLIEAFWPGPLSVVVRKRPEIPDVVTAGLDTIGVRMPAHDLALRFLTACGVPVAAPSANRSGRPSPTTAEAVLEDLDGRIACVLEGELPEVGVESTVVDCSEGDAVVLRPGGVSLEELRAVVASARLGEAVSSDARPRSPGSKYRHYAPSARVVLVDEPPVAPEGVRAAYLGVGAPASGDGWTLARACASVGELARDLYAFFRACDDAGVDVIVCRTVPPVGLGLAVMDRLVRAARG